MRVVKNENTFLCKFTAKVEKLTTLHVGSRVFDDSFDRNVFNVQSYSNYLFISTTYVASTTEV